MSFSGLHCQLGLGSKFWSTAGHNPELNLKFDSGTYFIVILGLQYQFQV